MKSQSFKEVWNESISAKFLLSFMLLTLIGSAYLVYYVIQEDKNWELFKAEHNCEIKLIYDSSEKSGWLCDDGIIYLK